MNHDYEALLWRHRHRKWGRWGTVAVVVALATLAVGLMLSGARW